MLGFEFKTQPSDGNRDCCCCCTQIKLFHLLPLPLEICKEAMVSLLSTLYWLLTERRRNDEHCTQKLVHDVVNWNEMYLGDQISGNCSSRLILHYQATNELVVHIYLRFYNCKNWIPTHPLIYNFPLNFWFYKKTQYHGLNTISQPTNWQHTQLIILQGCCLAQAS